MTRVGMHTQLTHLLKKRRSRHEEFFIDVAQLLKERSQRFRIGDSIFEEIPDNDQLEGNKGNDENDNVDDILKISQNTQYINFQPIGVDIFNLLEAGKHFNEENIHLKLCLCKSPKMTNHPIYHISRRDLYEVIQKGFLKQRMYRQAIYDQISEFLFFTMSCHPSEVLVHAMFDTLNHHLMVNTRKGTSSVQPWKPSIENIISVFCNYGAPKHLLIPMEIPLPQCTPSAIVIENPPPGSQFYLFKQNIFWVIKFVTSVLSNFKAAYTIKELDHLLCIIHAVKLDKYMMHCHTWKLNVEFANCITSILKSYPSSYSQEKGKVSDMSKMLYSKLKNVWIGDIYIIINFYIKSPGFGQKLAQSLSFAFVSGIVQPTKTVLYLDDVEVRDIRKLFKIDSLLEMDYLTQYYIMLILEKVVTNLIFTSRNMSSFNKLRHLLSNLRIKSPHSENMVDYLLVKELITRASTTWKLCAAEVE